VPIRTDRFCRQPCDEPCTAGDVEYTQASPQRGKLDDTRASRAEHGRHQLALGVALRILLHGDLRPCQRRTSGARNGRSARARLSRPLLVRLGDEEDDLPLAVEPQAHRGARTGGEPVPDNLDAPVLVSTGRELVANERAGLLLP
jgi:hypothetical protein